MTAFDHTCRVRRRPLVAGLAGIGLALTACGGSDGGGLSCARFVEPMDVQADMAVLSSLQLDLPDGLGFDPPVPADVTGLRTVEGRDPESVAVGFDTGATLEQLDGYYRSVFSDCPQGWRSADPSTGEVLWGGSDNNSTQYTVRFLDGVLVVEQGPM